MLAYLEPEKASCSEASLEHIGLLYLLQLAVTTEVSDSLDSGRYLLRYQTRFVDQFTPSVVSFQA
jgi:hypothetical protein